MMTEDRSSWTPTMAFPAYLPYTHFGGPSMPFFKDS